jgi:hypothetical protein
MYASLRALPLTNGPFLGLLHVTEYELQNALSPNHESKFCFLDFKRVYSIFCISLLTLPNIVMGTLRCAYVFSFT